jgi:serpin B
MRFGGSEESMRILGLLLAGLLVCGGGSRVCAAEVAQSRKGRDPSPQAAPADMKALVAGNSEFAYALYRALRGEPGNLFFSPHSISTALAMAYAGARGETAEQMKKTLRFDLPEPKLHPAFNKLGLALASRARRPAGREAGKGDQFQFSVANALWGQQGERLLPEFLDTLAENYGAGMNLLDFEHNADGARSAINQWVADQTRGKIQNLIAPSVIHRGTRLVLTNAIYFKASWETPFDPKRDCTGEFHLLDGKTAGVEMMVGSPRCEYAEGEGYQAIELPYLGESVGMVILVPAAGAFQAFEDGLTRERGEEIVHGLRPHDVDLRMPKFTYESAFALGRTLAGMGMPAAFGSGADFSGIDGKRDIAIDEVVHKALVSVDEAGTEAAAATGVMMATMLYPRASLTIDRPFMFMIRDRDSGTVLFMGRVLNPRG